MNAEQLAEQFHETYERLAPAFGYVTRKSSRVKWEHVPQKNRALMVAVSQTVLNMLQSEECAKATANSAIVQLQKMKLVVDEYGECIITKGDPYYNDCAELLQQHPLP